MRIFERIKNVLRLASSIDDRLQKVQQSLGRLENRQIAMQNPKNFNDFEYQVYSQWGEDGLIQYLISRVEIKRPIFVEFGVGNYTESNTRFLLINNNWSGLIIDGSEQNVQDVKNDPIYWKYNLKIECAFIDMDNINNLIQRNGISGEIGLLSIDIDGNDYWVWKEITAINPAIVVVEYNARFGKNRAVTLPYDPGFVREKAHYSNIYYGASLKALCFLAQEKGYSFVGTNSAGNNAFFVRKDLMNEQLKELNVEDGYVQNQFRESRNQDGKLAFLTNDQECRMLLELPLVDIEASGDLGIVPP